MAKKIIKKTKPATKKVVAKKVAKKETVKAVAETPTPKCGCGCHCMCCRGHRFIGVCIKLIILCMIFLLGCVSGPWIVRNAHQSAMRHIDFDDNGCVVLESVKCPKLLETLATSDNDADGCISHAELQDAIAELHRPDMQ